MIARGIEGSELLQGQRLAGPEIHHQLLSDVSRLVDEPARALPKLAVDERSRSRRLSDMNVRLGGARPHVHAVLAEDLARERLQVLVAEL